MTTAARPATEIPAACSYTTSRDTTPASNERLDPGEPERSVAVDQADVEAQTLS